MISGTWMEKDNCQMHGTGFTRFTFLNERTLDGYTWSGERRGNKKLLVLMMCGQKCGNLFPMQQKRKQCNDGLSRNQSSTMPEN